jgi:very-short-patch-repair endonuclease
VWETITDSDLEDLFRAVIRRLPFPMPEPQFKVFRPDGGFVGRYDFAYPQRCALIETDSEGFHMDPVSFQRDRQKQNEAHALGWTVYRFTWRQLIDDPESVRTIIRAIWADGRLRRCHA